MLPKTLFSYLSLGVTSSIFVWMWFYIPTKSELVTPSFSTVNKHPEFIQSTASDIQISIPVHTKAVNISAIKSPALVASKLKTQQTPNITSSDSINPHNSDEFIDPDADDLITSQEYLEQDTGEFIDPDV